jgi:mitochondrial fission protein ELM1
MLACRRARGGRAVVLMRPGLPRSWFDLCVIPAHDGVPASARVLISQGVLNPLRPAADKAPGVGLILVGGPSAHYGWDQAALCAQVRAIAAADRRHWTVATSRRTPAATVAALQALASDNLDIVPSANTAPGWLAAQLAPTPLVWVTEDSVSMLYEALTAGAACGVLPVPLVRAGRVSAGVQALLKDGIVGSFADWQNGRAPMPPQTPFDEAARCARWIRQQWFAR